MPDDKYNRSISLLCPTCGGDQFEFDDEEATTFKCGACGLEIEKEALIEANSENIGEHTKEVGKEIADDLMKGFKNSLRGSKAIKFK